MRQGCSPTETPCSREVSAHIAQASASSCVAYTRSHAERPRSPLALRWDANSPCKRCAAPDELEYDPGPHSRQTEALEAPAIRFQSTRTVETDARTSSEPLIRNSSKVKGWSSKLIILSRYAGALSQGVGCHTVVSSDTAARRKHGAETEPVYLRSVTRHSDKMPHRHVSMLLHSQRSGGRPP